MAKQKREKAAKKVNYQLIDKYEVNQLKFTEPYQLLGELVASHHRRLENLTVVLAWRLNVQPSRDGKIELAKPKRASDLDRVLHDGGADFIVLLNKDAWETLLPDQRLAVLDHELTHLEVERDGAGYKEDENGRAVTRIRKHDLEEFVEVVERHGCYLKDLEDLVEASLRSGRRKGD